MFILQVKSNLKLNYSFSNQIYGVTRDPKSKEYAIVTKFSNGGSLRDVIKKNHSILNWKTIITMLFNHIGNGLYGIHVDNYHHRDFHSGNILNDILNNYIKPNISDFGLCCPADQSSVDKTLYGLSHQKFYAEKNSQQQQIFTDSGC